MKKHIPQRTEVTCDFCLRTDTQIPFRREAVVSIQQIANNMYGEAAACGSVQWDACDTCAEKIQSSIEKLLPVGGSNVR